MSAVSGPLAGAVERDWVLFVQGEKAFGEFMGVNAFGVTAVNAIEHSTPSAIKHKKLEASRRSNHF